MRFRPDKKLKYLILSVLITFLIFQFVQEMDRGGGPNLNLVLGIIIVTITGTFLVQYPNMNWKHMILSNIMPLHLVIGAVLAFTYFPNLGVPVKLAFVLLLGTGFYLVNLVNNIFLVVEDRKELIPLYRAAVTWGQIIVMVVAIPFFAGVFKLPVSALTQNMIAAVSAFLFSVYSLWMLSYDPDIKDIDAGEGIIFSSFVSFLVWSSGISVSFFPTESFLRALFVSSVLMMALSYLYSYLKNNITRKNIIEYFFITFIFFFILILFIP